MSLEGILANFLIGFIIGLVAQIIAYKLVAKFMKYVGVKHAVVEDIADKWGYIGHLIGGYVSAHLTSQNPVVSGVLLASLFMAYELIQHYVPDQRKDVLEFVIAYTTTIASIYNIKLASI